MEMSPLQLEYAISQYIDGNLDELSQATLEEALATQPAAQAMLGEFQSLQALLVASQAIPELEAAVDWHQFAAGISQQVAGLDAPIQRNTLRIGRWSGVLAIAAVIAIVGTLAVRLHPATSLNNSQAGRSVAVNTAPIDVSISAAPALAQAAAVSEIQVGQPANIAGYPALQFSSADAIVTAPSSIWVASGNASAQDTEPMPY